MDLFSETTINLTSGSHFLLGTHRVAMQAAVKSSEWEWQKKKKKKDWNLPDVIEISSSM